MTASADLCFLRIFICNLSARSPKTCLRRFPQNTRFNSSYCLMSISLLSFKDDELYAPGIPKTIWLRYVHLCCCLYGKITRIHLQSTYAILRRDAVLIPVIASRTARLFSFENAELYAPDIPKTIWLGCASFSAASMGECSQCIGASIFRKYGFYPDSVRRVIPSSLAFCAIAMMQQ